MRRRKSFFVGAKYLIAGAFVAGAFVATSNGANADGKAGRAAPAVQQATNWSGVYFGVHSGWQWSEIDASIGGVNVFSVEHDAPVVGGQIGIQHQFGLFVLGVEAALTTSFLTDFGSTPCPNPAFTCAARMVDVLTVGPRLGWALGKYMPYITAGYASGAFDSKISINAASANPFRTHERHSGWFVGAGVDMALAHGWTIGLDYRHYEYDDATHQPVRNLAGGVVDLSQPAFVADVSSDIITVRVSWKLGRTEPARPLK